MTSKQFAGYIGFNPDTLRGMETSRPCNQKLIDDCKRAAGATEDEETAAALEELWQQLQQIRDEESARLDPQLGAQRKPRRPRPRLGDAGTIAGPWYMVWQTSRGQREAVVLEAVDIEPTGPRKGLFSISNQAGGKWLEAPWSENGDEPEHFRWEGGGGFFHHWVSGHFASVPKGPVVSGAFHLKLDNFPSEMAGIWNGVSPDSESTYALLVLGRTEKAATLRFEAEREGNPELPYLPPSDRNGKEAD